MECLNMSGYFQQLERHLDCPKPLRSSFLNQTRRMAEDFVQGKPDATQRELVDYLGEPQELAQGFLETLDLDVLERYRKRKKLALCGCIAVLVAALIGVSIWCAVLWHTPSELEVTDTLIIYSEPKENLK